MTYDQVADDIERLEDQLQQLRADFDTEKVARLFGKLQQQKEDVDSADFDEGQRAKLRARLKDVGQTLLKTMEEHGVS